MNLLKLVTVKIPFLPDVSMPKYQMRYGNSAQEEASIRIFDWLGYISSLKDAHNNFVLTLRYLFDPSAKPSQQRLSIYLLVNFGNVENTTGEVDFPGNHILTDFFQLEQYEQSPVFTHLCNTGVIFLIVKQEEILKEKKHEILYYAPKPFSYESNKRIDALFWDSLFATIQHPCLVDISLRPLLLTMDDRYDIVCELQELETAVSGFSIEHTRTGTKEQLLHPRDVVADRHRKIYQGYMDTFFSDIVFEYCIRVASSDYQTADTVARTVAVELSKNGSFEIIKYNHDDPIFISFINAIKEGRIFYEQVTPGNITYTGYSKELSDKASDFLKIQEKRVLRALRLSRLRILVEKEVAKEFLRLPIPGNGYLKTICLESELPRKTYGGMDYNSEINAASGNICIGSEQERARTAELSLDQLQKHMFVAGVTGSGKTTSILNILIQLWEKQGVPFLVFESAKSEYRILKNIKSRIGENLNVFTVGNERISPFRFNPLEFGNSITLNEHLSDIEMCFKGALPLVNPMPALISEAIELLYFKRGWNGEDLGNCGKLFPSMLDLPSAAREIMKQREYSGEVRQNIETAIDVRLGMLCRRNVGRIFATYSSIPNIPALMKIPTVLELDYLNQEQINLITLFILASIRKYLKVNSRKKDLKHVIVIEEAHNLVGGTTANLLLENLADPKGEATKFIVKMLAEVRALGEGIIISDQTPSAVAPEVIKNTGVKLVHRTVAGDDRECLAQAMLLDTIQKEDLARLLEGEAFLYSESHYRPVRVLNLFPTSKVDCPSDDDLIKKIKTERWFDIIVNERLGRINKFWDDDLENIKKSLDVLEKERNFIRKKKNESGTEGYKISEFMGDYKLLGEKINRYFDNVGKQMKQDYECYLEGIKEKYFSEYQERLNKLYELHKQFHEKDWRMKDVK